MQKVDLQLKLVFVIDEYLSAPKGEGFSLWIFNPLLMELRQYYRILKNARYQN